MRETTVAPTTAQAPTVTSVQVWGRWRAPRARVSAEGQEWSHRSQQELGSGRLPLSSQERLADTDAPFTSDLTVAQVAALRSGGWEPVGQVFGSAVITRSARYFRHPFIANGPQYTWSDPLGNRPQPPSWTAAEVLGWYDADRAARRGALRRMRLEMERLGAHGAVGLRVLDRQLTGAPVAECTLVATAIRAVTPVASTPFVTEMTAADLVALRRVGYVPCGPLFTIARFLTCSWDGGVRTSRGSLTAFATAPRELAGPTDVASVARRHARSALFAQMSGFPGASMVLHDLDVRLSDRRCEGGGGTSDLLADVIATGTAIVPATARSAPPSPGWLSVRPVVPLTTTPSPPEGVQL